MKKAICAVYFTGPAGQNMGMFYFGDGDLMGADIGGIKYDGKVQEQADGSLVGQVKFTVPAGTQIITGLTAGAQQQEVVTSVRLPNGFASSGEIVRIDTPVGPVNARFELLRELP